MLSPLRVEVLSRRPYIVVLHQLVTDAELERFRRLAGPRLATSRHRRPDGEFVSSMSRISKKYGSAQRSRGTGHRETWYRSRGQISQAQKVTESHVTGLQNRGPEHNVTRRRPVSHVAMAYVIGHVVIRQSVFLLIQSEHFG